MWVGTGSPLWQLAPLCSRSVWDELTLPSAHLSWCALAWNNNSSILQQNRSKRWEGRWLPSAETTLPLSLDFDGGKDKSCDICFSFLFETKVETDRLCFVRRRSFYLFFFLSTSQTRPSKLLKDVLTSGQKKKKTLSEPQWFREVGFKNEWCWVRVHCGSAFRLEKQPHRLIEIWRILKWSYLSCHFWPALVHTKIFWPFSLVILVIFVLQARCLLM